MKCAVRPHGSLCPPRVQEEAAVQSADKLSLGLKQLRPQTLGFPASSRTRAGLWGGERRQKFSAGDCSRILSTWREESVQGALPSRPTPGASRELADSPVEYPPSEKSQGATTPPIISVFLAFPTTPQKQEKAPIARVGDKILKY